MWVRGRGDWRGFTFEKRSERADFERFRQVLNRRGGRKTLSLGVRGSTNRERLILPRILINDYFFFFSSAATTIWTVWPPAISNVPSSVRRS